MVSLKSFFIKTATQGVGVVNSHQKFATPNLNLNSHRCITCCGNCGYMENKIKHNFEV